MLCFNDGALVGALGYIEGLVWMRLRRALGRTARRAAARKEMVL